MIAKPRGADTRITAVVANRFNHVYLAAPGITSIKQLKGKKVAVSRFGSGSHFQSNLALKVEYAITRSIQVLATRPFPTAAGIQTVLDELGKETKLKSSKLEDFVDLRALRKLEKDGFFK
jgi:hypothetical protein